MTLTDPWAQAPAQETAPVLDASLLAGIPVSTGAAAATAAYAAVAATKEGKITLTFKGAGGFGDRWLVAHVANPVEGLELLNDPKFKELLDLSKRISEYDGNTAQSASPASGGGSTAPRSNVPQGATEAPAWAPAKPFDDFVYVTKVSPKTGKPWHAWMPPGKNDSRDPLFFNPPR